MKNYNRAIILVGLGLSSASAAQGQNLISCTSASGLAGCTFAQPVLDAKVYPYEVEYSVQFNYNCPVDFYLAVKSDLQTERIPWQQTGSNTYKVLGRSGLQIIDTDPTWTSGSEIITGCSFVVESFSAVPSSGTKTLWTNEENSLESLISALDKAVKRAEALIAYENATGALTWLSGLFEAELESALATLLTIKNNEDLNDTLWKVARDRESGLSGDVRGSLRIVLEEIDELPDDCDGEEGQDNCEPAEIVERIKNELSEAERADIESLGGFAEVIADSRTYLEAEKTSLKDKQDELKGLCMISKDHITWESLPEGCS